MVHEQSRNENEPLNATIEHEQQSNRAGTHRTLNGESVLSPTHADFLSYVEPIDRHNERMGNDRTHTQKRPYLAPVSEHQDEQKRHLLHTSRQHTHIVMRRQDTQHTRKLQCTPCSPSPASTIQSHSKYNASIALAEFTHHPTRSRPPHAQKSLSYSEKNTKSKSLSRTLNSSTP